MLVTLADADPDAFVVAETLESSTLGPDTLAMIISWFEMTAPLVVSDACHVNVAVVKPFARMVSGWTEEVRLTPFSVMLSDAVLSPIVTVTVDVAFVAPASAVRVVL